MDSKVKILRFLKNFNLNNDKIDIYTKALIHRSLTHETDLNNERLEFLGDAVLEFIVTDYLYRNFLEFDEGKLSQLRSIIVSAEYLSNFAQQISLDKILLLGKGEEINGGRRKKSILSDAMESLIGAIYIAEGIEKTRDFCKEFIEKNIEILLNSEELKNPKSKIQEISQKLYGILPVYDVVKEEKVNGEIYYIMYLRIKDIDFGPIRANSKRDAEQILARMALTFFEGL